MTDLGGPGGGFAVGPVADVRDRDVLPLPGGRCRRRYEAPLPPAATSSAPSWSTSGPGGGGGRGRGCRPLGRRVGRG
jgi:hypothetical protein